MESSFGSNPPHSPLSSAHATHSFVSQSEGLGQPVDTVGRRASQYSKQSDLQGNKNNRINPHFARKQPRMGGVKDHKASEFKQFNCRLFYTKNCVK